MSTEENYLDSLLRAVTEPKIAESVDMVQDEVKLEDTAEEDTVNAAVPEEEPVSEERPLPQEEKPDPEEPPLLSEEEPLSEEQLLQPEEEPVSEEPPLLSEEEPVSGEPLLPPEEEPLSEEPPLSQEMSAAEEMEAEEQLIQESLPQPEEASAIPDFPDNPELADFRPGAESPDTEQTDLNLDSTEPAVETESEVEMPEPQDTEPEPEIDIREPEMSEPEDIEPESEVEISEPTDIESEPENDIQEPEPRKPADIESEPEVEMLGLEDIEPESEVEIPEPADIESEPEVNIPEPEIPEPADIEPEPEIPQEGDPDLEDLEISDIAEAPEEDKIPEPESDFNPDDLDIPDIPEAEEGFNLEDAGKSETDSGVGIGDMEMPEIPDAEQSNRSDLNIDGLDEAIQSETERELAGELNIEDLDLGDISVGVDDMPEIPDISDELGMLGDDMKPEAPIDVDDNLDDVLSMLDDDAELAEINDMLKKSDNNEPIQDDMMDLLNQMADDEAASVNAGIKHADEDDGGVPLPEIPSLPSNEAHAEAASGADEESSKKKKASKKKKKGNAEATEADSRKEPGKMGKLFNLLTEDLVPEPTEEELEAEKKAKEAKKQEETTKKEQDKAAKEEEKKAKAEEKEAAKKAKAEAAAQKKKEKQAAKGAKIAAKKAKQAAEPKVKRIPPKKIAAVALFGASVGAAVIVATGVLSREGYLESARKAYYNQDYKTVYQNTYGMELDKTKSDGLIQAKSEIILKLQCRYNSYLTNLKMGREIEALDALLQGILTYDTINADAEQFEVLPELDLIMTNIYSTLEARYGLDEAAARELVNNEDALSYTVALSDIISGN